MDPRTEYSRRHELCRDRLRELKRTDDRIAVLRAVAVLAALGLWLVSYFASAIAFLVFLAAALWHRRIRRRERVQQRLAAWYERALARLRGEWEDGGSDGAEWSDAEHPYSGELDILGARSLYARLCHATTASGRARLAEWLCVGAAPGEIAERQDAVDELCGQLDAREAMWLASPRRLAPPQTLPQWVQREDGVDLRWRSLAALVLALSMSACVLLWLSGKSSALPLLLATIPSYAFARWLGPQLEATVDELDHVRAELRAVEALLALLDREQFRCARLRRIGEELHADATTTRARLRALHRLGDWHEAARNAFFAPLAALWLWRLQWALRIEAWRRRHGAELLAALEALADYEALQSLARHAFENPGHVRPRVDEESDEFDARGLAHPLLPGDAAVANDIRLDRDCRLYVVSGSNMSGKSTWLRCIGVNVVLAMCGARVRAASLSMPPLAVAASLRASDSLAAGESRFAAELHRLRIVVAAAEREPRLLFLLDEIFHGTHSQDRREGARAFLDRLLAGRHMGLVTTHDLALTELDGDWGMLARNVHFRDEVEGDRAVFDYRVHDGVVQHSNALRLMRAQGLI